MSHDEHYMVCNGQHSYRFVGTHTSKYAIVVVHRINSTRSDPTVFCHNNNLRVMRFDMGIRQLFLIIASLPDTAYSLDVYKQTADDLRQVLRQVRYQEHLLLGMDANTYLPKNKGVFASAQHRRQHGIYSDRPRDLLNDCLKMHV